MSDLKEEVTDLIKKVTDQFINERLNGGTIPAMKAQVCAALASKFQIKNLPIEFAESPAEPGVIVPANMFTALVCCGVIVDPKDVEGKTEHRVPGYGLVTFGPGPGRVCVIPEEILIQAEFSIQEKS
jgi:hypothetical protein